MTDLDALRKNTEALVEDYPGEIPPPISVACATVLALLDVLEAARALSEDEESQEGGWGPDITMLIPLRAALARLGAGDE